MPIVPSTSQIVNHMINAANATAFPQRLAPLELPALFLVWSVKTVFHVPYAMFKLSALFNITGIVHSHRRGAYRIFQCISRSFFSEIFGDASYITKRLMYDFFKKKVLTARAIP